MATFQGALYQVRIINYQLSIKKLQLHSALLLAMRVQCLLYWKTPRYALKYLPYRLPSLNNTLMQCTYISILIR